jgi:hypothetical protein
MFPRDEKAINNPATTTANTNGMDFLLIINCKNFSNIIKFKANKDKMHLFANHLTMYLEKIDKR